MRLIRSASVFCVALTLAAVTGCGPARRPEPQPPPRAPQPLPSGMHAAPAQPQHKEYPAPRAGISFNDPSEAASSVASAVPNAGPVEVVVLGNVALTGLNNQSGQVHHNVAQQITTAVPHIAEVRVTTEAAAVGRLRAIRQEIAVQNSIAPYLPELAGLSGRMVPVP